MAELKQILVEILKKRLVEGLANELGKTLDLMKGTMDSISLHEKKIEELEDIFKTMGELQKQRLYGGMDSSTLISIEKKRHLDEIQRLEDDDKQLAKKMKEAYSVCEMELEGLEWMVDSLC